MFWREGRAGLSTPGSQSRLPKTYAPCCEVCIEGDRGSIWRVPMLFIRLQNYPCPMNFDVRKGFMHLLVPINTHNTHHYNFEPNLLLLKDI